MKREKSMNRRSRLNDTDILNNINVADPTFNKEVREALVTFSEEINNIDLLDIISIAPSGSFNISKQPSDILPSSEGYTKANERLLNQLTKTKETAQPSLFDNLLKTSPEYKEICEENNIDRIGAHLSSSCHCALDAIQRLFTSTDYKGNTGSGSLRITVADYLKEYGVKKRLNKSGKLVYLSKEREDAISALWELNKPIFWYYKRENIEATKKNKGKRKYDIVKGIDPIIRIKKGYKGVSEEDANIIMANKGGDSRLSHLEINLTEVFTTGKYFLRPIFLFNTIKEKYKNAPAHLFSFVNFLCSKASYHNYTFKISYEALAIKLDLQYLIVNRKKKKLIELLDEDFTREKELGLLMDYEKGRDYMGEEQVSLILNEKAYYQKKSLKGEENKPSLDMPLEEPVKPFVETL